MTDKKDLKRRVRARMAETNEKYATARSHVVGTQQAESPPGAASNEDSYWRTLRALTKRLGQLLAEMDAGSHFRVLSDTDFEAAVKEAAPFHVERVQLRAEWRLGLVSTATTLAKHLHLDAEMAMSPEYAAFIRPTRENVPTNPIVGRARLLHDVASHLLAEYEAA